MGSLACWAPCLYLTLWALPKYLLVLEHTLNVCSEIVSALSHPSAYGPVGPTAIFNILIWDVIVWKICPKWNILVVFFPWFTTRWGQCLTLLMQVSFPLLLLPTEPFLLPTEPLLLPPGWKAKAINLPYCVTPGLLWFSTFISSILWIPLLLCSLL